jgi:hypothetical protein
MPPSFGTQKHGGGREKYSLRLTAPIAGEERASLCEMMYPIEEYTKYTLLWGTSSH